MNKTHGSVQAHLSPSEILGNFMREIWWEFPVSVVSGFGGFGFRSLQRPYQLYDMYISTIKCKVSENIIPTRGIKGEHTLSNRQVNFILTFLFYDIFLL
jgi:hypothetical protein